MGTPAKRKQVQTFAKGFRPAGRGPSRSIWTKVLLSHLTFPCPSPGMASRRAPKRAVDVRSAPGDVRRFSTHVADSRPKDAPHAPGAGGCNTTQTLNLNRFARDYNVKISSYAKQASWRDACCVLSTMSQAKVKPDVISYNATISACGKGWQWRQALGLFAEMPQAKVKPDAISYNAAINASGKGGQWQQALVLFTAMPQAKVKLDVISYSAAISACEKDGQWQQALGLFGSMPQAKVQPNVISYNSAISTCAKGGRWPQALGLFRAMPQAKVQPTVISYNAAISACEKGGQWQQALVLFRAMPEAKVKLDVISYNAAMSACEKGGQWQQALGLFGAISEAKIQPTVISYSAAISACEKGRQWQQALGLFGEMPQAKVNPDVISYNAAIIASGKGGQWQQALALFGAMPQSKVQPNVISYFALLDALFNKPHGPIFFERGLSANVFPKLTNVSPHIIDLHDLSEGAAQLAVRWWLAMLVAPCIGEGLHVSEPYKCIIVTGYGRSRKGWDTTDVRAAVLNMLWHMKLSARVLESNAGRLQLVLSKRDTPLLQKCFKVAGASRAHRGIGVHFWETPFPDTRRLRVLQDFHFLRQHSPSAPRDPKGPEGTRRDPKGPEGKG